MRLFAAPAALALVLGLTACAPTAGGAPTTDGGVPTATNENDCAVIAAVAREHFRIGPDNTPPPLWLDDEGSGWEPRCDWSRWGVAFPQTFDPDREPAPGERVRWLRFKQPRYDGQGATIEVGILHGPLAGQGSECRLRSGVAGWTVDQCRGTWIS